MPHNKLLKPKQLNDKFIIGVTGGIGSGKTTVTDMFASLGIQVIDTDVLARNALALNSPLLTQVFNKFGLGLKLADGSLDRAALRELVFSQPEHKLWLEGLVHPWVRNQALRELEEASGSYIIYSSPLLIESEHYLWANRVLIVDLKPELQIKRVSARDASSEELVKKIIAQQVSRNQRLSYADDVISNDKDLDFLQEQVSLLHQKYMNLSQHI